MTFTYHESNTGTDPISGVVVSGSICGSATYVSGDTNSNGILDPGETWVYTCSHTFTAAGSFTDNATATGTDTVDSQAAPTELASASVTVSPSGKANFTPGFYKNHQAFTTSLLPQTVGTFVVITFTVAHQILTQFGCGSAGVLNCLAAEVLTAELNLAQGGSSCIVTDGVLGQANALLTTYNYIGPASTYSLSKADTTLAMTLHDLLATYNQDAVATC